MMRDWDDAYANMAHVPGSDALPGLWAAQAAQYRASGVRLDTGLRYGAGARETFDLVWPDSTPRGLAVFVHGGYWMKLDPSLWTHLAEGARARGWAVALPGYTLAPEARIGAITAQIGAAVTAAAAQVAGPVRLAGHSAGGHLVTRMLCADSPLAPDLRERLAHVTSISGVHDLRPLLHTQMNATLRLDLAQARTESPALAEPFGAVPLHVWVGGSERPEFIRQAELMANVWSGFDPAPALTIDPGHNHFTVIDALGDPASPLTRAFAGDA